MKPDRISGNRRSGMEQKQEKEKIRISVRNLVEFIFREGDIDNRRKTVSADAMTEGTRIHRKIQKSRGENYFAEVPLQISIEEEHYVLVIEGRADGIFTETKQGGGSDVSSGEVQTDSQAEECSYIEEIKGTYRKLGAIEAPVYVHQAQAMCYAYIFAWQNSLSRIGIQMTYCNLETEETKSFREIFSWEAIQKWFADLVLEYKKWADFQSEWHSIRQQSIKKLSFPFPYREGQKKLVSDVYRSILRKKTLFIEAPTGAGKTISTVFPAVKAVGEGLSDRIFYLTAKTITAAVAKDTFRLLMDGGYQAKIIQLTAKEKLCLCDEMECNPDHCPYAKGHFDRVNDAVYEFLQSGDFFTREEIIKQAKTHMVCPFEMSLDVASWADDIICDYNYVFDPNVRLKRFFQEGMKGDYLFLVDEAHNLVERSREMYSALLYKEDILLVRKLLKEKSHQIVKLLSKCNEQLLSYKRECERYMVYEHIGPLHFTLMRLASELDEFLQKQIEFPERKTVLEFYMNLRNFLNIYELVDEHYVIYTELAEDGRFLLKLYCVDPSKNLQSCIDQGTAAVFFSATLLPIQYYKKLLSTKTDNYAVYANSTFSEKQRILLFGRDVSTKYTRRNRSEYEKIAAYIGKAAGCKEGNYMVFFPSYKLMEEVHDIFTEQYQTMETIMQRSGMTEAEREEFLAEFEQPHPGAFVAFCVMGGIFGEGIDLTEDRLIGVIVVGTGLPQVNNERDILKNYYDETEGNGFDYAFRCPGINKVLQAAGRVIRTGSDHGMILLLDERFLQSDYAPLYPREWADRKICTLSNVEGQIQKFWAQNP